MSSRRRVPGLSGHRLLNLVWPGHPHTWREVPARVLPFLRQILRLTVAAVISYLLTVWLTDGPIDLTGSLTAILVLQASTYGTLKMGMVRVGAVLTGVGVALALSLWVGLTWWSLGLAIFLALALAKVFRLGDQALETPISAMLILGTSAHAVGAETRVLTTFIGAGIGIAFAVLLPPAVPVRQATQSVRRVAAALESTLRRSADDIRTHQVTRDDVTSWLYQVNRIGEELGRAQLAVRQAGEARRFNPRTIGTADMRPPLQSAIDALEKVLFSVRALYLDIERESPRARPRGDGPELDDAFAVLLDTVGESVGRFGWLVEAEISADELEVAQRYRIAEEALGEARAMLTDLMMIDVSDVPSLWLLREPILSGLDQVLGPLDLHSRAERRERWRRQQAGRIVATRSGLSRDSLVALAKDPSRLRPSRVVPPDN